MQIKLPDGHPLARLGIENGDILRTVNREALDRPGSITKLLPMLRNSSAIVIELVRDGKPQTVTVEVDG